MNGQSKLQRPCSRVVIRDEKQEERAPINDQLIEVAASDRQCSKPASQHDKER